MIGIPWLQTFHLRFGNALGLPHDPDISPLNRKAVNNVSCVRRHSARKFAWQGDPGQQLLHHEAWKGLFMGGNNFCIDISNRPNDPCNLL